MPLAEAVMCHENYISQQQRHQPEAQTTSEPTDDDDDCQFELLVAKHDPHDDLTALKRVARWAEEFSPLFGLEEAAAPESLWLDLTGGTHLFGGPLRCADRIKAALQAHGFVTEVRLAPTFGAAWALTHYAPLRTSTTLNAAASSSRSTSHRHLANESPRPPSAHPYLDQLLPPLPLAALRLPHQHIELLQELGIFTIGQLDALPRSSLPSRFGTQILLRLDQAFGRAPELLPRVMLTEPVRADWQSDFPLKSREQLRAVNESLVETLLTQLRSRNEGLRRVRCEVLGLPLLDGETNGFALKHGRPAAEITVELLVPNSDTKHLTELLELQWNRTALPDGIIRVTLNAEAFGITATRQRALFGNETPDELLEVSQLINRLSGRLGPQAVLKPHVLSEQAPERAFEFIPWVRCLDRIPKRTEKAERQQTLAAAMEPRRPRAIDRSAPHQLRPLRLLKSPQPIEMQVVTRDQHPHRFRWQDLAHFVRQHWGPETITEGWWRDDPAERDYFRVELTTGQHYWIFRRHTARDWFLHGFFE